MDAIAPLINKTLIDQESLIKKHAPLVKRIAHHLLARLPKNIQLEDLIQAGMIGLLEAAMHYDEAKGASFETYANIRVRGHMIDEVRRNDWVPRSVYKNARMISMAMKNLENKLGRDAKDQEIATELNISLEDYHAMLHDSATAHLYAIEELGISEDAFPGQENKNYEPHEIALNTDIQNQLSSIINALPQKEKLVLSLYYEHDFNLKEIGAILGVSESRVSQIHSQATNRIRTKCKVFL